MPAWFSDSLLLLGQGDPCISVQAEPTRCKRKRDPKPSTRPRDRNRLAGADAPPPKLLKVKCAFLTLPLLTRTRRSGAAAVATLVSMRSFLSSRSLFRPPPCQQPPPGCRFLPDGLGLQYIYTFLSTQFYTTGIYTYIIQLPLIFPRCRITEYLLN